MPKIKKYVMTALTLGIIGASSALLIAGANLLTNSKIEENQKLSQEKALKEVFSDALSFSDKYENFKENSDYLKYYCVAYQDNESSVELGYVYFVSGRNSYGEVAMMVGVTMLGIGNISIVTNTESYASTLEEKYINPYKMGNGSLDDVNCGATYGAKLIKAMCDAALSDYNTQKGVN